MISRLNLNLVLFYTYDESLNIDSAKNTIYFILFFSTKKI